MEEQHLTMFQRSKVNYHLRNGEPLPPPRQPKYERAQDYEEQLAIEIMMRAKNARKRSLEVIQASGAFEIEKYNFNQISDISLNTFSSRYVPIHHLRESSEKQKIRLQERMSGLKQHPELSSLQTKACHKFKNGKQREKIDPMTQCKINLKKICQVNCLCFKYFEIVMTEIYERADWLAEMEAIGEGKKHRQIIQAEIAERLRQVKMLEKKRQIEQGALQVVGEPS